MWINWISRPSLISWFKHILLYSFIRPVWVMRISQILKKKLLLRKLDKNIDNVNKSTSEKSLK